MKPFSPLLTSNSFWLGIVNMLLCVVVGVTPLFQAYPKVCFWLLVANNVLFIVFKYLSGTLPPPQPPSEAPIARKQP